MKNISATLKPLPVSLATLAIAGSMVVTTVWGAWATHELLQLKKREVVTVQLSRVMGDFIETEARAGRPAEESRQRVQAYLQAVEKSVQGLGSDGRTVLVAEAVVAGSAPDFTETVRKDIARRLGGQRHASR